MKSSSYIKQIIQSKRVVLLVLLSLLSAGCDNARQSIEINNDNGHLQILRVSGLALSPVFEITQNHYVSTADFSVTKINLQAWTKFPDDDVSINGQMLDEKKDYRLAIGNNKFSIKVMNPQGVKEQYQLTVTRLADNKMNKKLLANGENNEKFITEE